MIVFQRFPLAVLCCLIQLCQGQIQLYSITNSRQTGGDAGYTFDGLQMSNSSRRKLLNPANFGAQGIYPKLISIKDAFETSGSLDTVTRLPINSLFFFGTFLNNEPSLQKFTPQEIDSLYAWSLRGAKLIITSGINDPPQMTDQLNSTWDYALAKATTTCYPTVEGINSGLFNGPFGSVKRVLQAGSLQGYFTTVPPDARVLADDGDGHPTVVVDCKTLDLMIADVDMVTSVSRRLAAPDFTGTVDGIATDDAVRFDNERFLANAIAFMDQMQQSPILTKSGSSLMVDGNYTSYQWYWNGKPVGGANSARYDGAEDEGWYYVEVGTNGGCRLRSDTIAASCEVFVPTAFSPNNNGANEKACVYTQCAAQVSFIVFDRWGELVFRSRENEPCWDGLFKGEKAPSGVYAWRLEATEPSGRKLTKSGNITLVR